MNCENEDLKISDELAASVSTEFVVEFEESQWEPGNWKELLRVPGNHHSAVPRLHGHVDYRFRVSAVNGVGRGQPSEPSERYKTPPSGLPHPSLWLCNRVRTPIKNQI